MQNRLEIQLALEDIESGIARLRATKNEMRGLEDAASDAERASDRFGDELEETSRKSERARNSFASLGRAVAALAGFFAIREVLQYANAFQEAQNRIRLVTETTEELIDTQEKLQAIAQNTFGTFGATADLYSRLARSTEQLEVSQARLLSVTETVNKTIALSGAGAQSANAALFQLGQGLGAGALRGEELNSVLEQTPELARAIADGLGVSIAELRRLGAEGELTAQRVIGALEKQAEAVDEKFGDLVPTIGQVQTVVREAFATAFVKEFENELTRAGLTTLELRDAIADLGTLAGKVFAKLIELSTDYVDTVSEGVSVVTLQLERLGAIKPEINFDPENIEAVRQALVDVNTQITGLEQRLNLNNERRVVFFPIQGEEREQAIAELERLQSQADQLVAILTNQVTPAANAAAVSLDNLFSSPANDNLTESVTSVKQSLLDQIAIAERLAEAAEGGKIAFEIELNDIELDRLAQDAVEKAQQAGEELSFATARLLVGRIDDLDKTTQALLDAEAALRERAGDRADDIARGLENEIDGFFNRVQDTDLRRAGPNAAAVLAELDREFLALAEFIDDASLGLNQEQLEALYARLEEAGIFLGMKVQEGAETGALGLSASIREALKNGVSGLSIGAELTANFADIGSQFFDSIDGAIEAFKREGSKSLEAIAGLAARIGTSLEEGLKDLGSFVGGNLGGALGQAGQVAGAVAAVAQLISSAVTFFKNLFGGGAALTFNLNTGADSFTNKGKDLDAVRDLGSSFTGIAQQFADLLGAQISNDLGVRFRVDDGDILPSVRRLSDNSVVALPEGSSGVNDTVTSDPEEALRIALGLVIDEVLIGADQALAGLAQRLLRAGEPLEDIAGILEAVSRAAESGQQKLADFAVAAANAGLSADQITDGVNKIAGVLELAEPPLSNIAKAVRDLDDATGGAIEALQSAGQAFDDITRIGNDAGRALGVSFIDRILKETERLSNPAAADFRALLEAQAQDLADAQLLLSRGFINEDEFRVVQQRNALGQTKFFENLDQEALNELGDYLGLIRENGGEAAVVLLQFNQELDATREKLTSGLTAMREEADRFFAAAQQNFNLSDDIRRRLSNETGTVQLATFRADLLGLLEQARGGDVTAAERAPDVARQFIELAERQFQGAAGLGEARDFVTNVLDQIGNVAQGFGNETLSQIELAEQQIGLLDQIKGVLESPDPALDVLQSILVNGEIQSRTLQSLLDQYVQLSLNSPAQSFTPGQVQQAAQQIVIPSDLKITNTVSTDAPGTVLAINEAARQRRDDEQRTYEVMQAMERRIGEQGEAITKLDQTLRRFVA